jgi:DNA-binding CsgD family transcriptional regulator/tetratricopeptide (TPR) repeat protein
MAFIGRLAEFALLEDAAGAALEGDPGAVLIGGEAGVGKTRLVTEYASRMKAAGACVLTGGCFELSGGGLPYGPIVEALRELVQEPGWSTVRSLLGPTDAEVVYHFVVGDRQDEELHDRAGARVAQLRLFQVLLRLLNGLGDQRVTILVVEDLHWVDRSTLDALTFLIRNLRRERILILGTYRTDEPRTGQPLWVALPELARGERVRVLELPRFRREELAEFLGTILAEAPSPELVARIFSESDGNAFFAEELLAASAGDDQRPLPPRLRDVLIARVEALSDDAREVLRVAATVGRQVDHRLVAAVSDLPQQRLLSALRKTVAHQILVTDPGGKAYLFRHALMREAVDADLLPGERMLLHGRIASAIQEDPGLASAHGVRAAVELAHHWDAAGDLPEALVAAVAAGRAAASLYAFAEAQRLLERSLRLWEHVPDAERRVLLPRHQLLALAAEAARWAEDIHRSVELLRAAVAEVDLAHEPVEGAMLYERLGHCLWEAGEGELALAAYDEAGRLLAGTVPSAERARVLAAQGAALMLSSRYEESRPRCEKAIAMARSVGARAAEGHAVNTLGFDLAMLGHAQEGIDRLLEAKRIAEQEGTLDDIRRAYTNLATVLDLTGQLGRSLEVAQEGIDRIRHMTPWWGTAGGVLFGILASLRFRFGAWAEAEQLIREGLERHIPAGLAMYLYVTQVDLETARGRLDRAAEALANAFTASERVTDPLYLGLLQAASAELAIWQGNLEAARAAVAAGIDIVDKGEDGQLLARLCALGIRTEADQVTVLLGRQPDGFVSAGQRLLDWANGVSERLQLRHRAFPELEVHLATCEAEQARLESRPVPEQWMAVAAGWEQLGQPYPAAYARWRQAEAMLQAKARRERVGAVLAAALAAAELLGAEPLKAEVVQLARRSRLDLGAATGGTMSPEPAPSPPGPARLTRRELEVLERITRGLTNRQIARDLFISEKTASVHVSNIIAKLGVSNRVEAAGVAHRLGLVSSQGSSGLGTARP